MIQNEYITQRLEQAQCPHVLHEQGDDSHQYATQDVAKSDDISALSSSSHIEAESSNFSLVEKSKLQDGVSPPSIKNASPGCEASLPLNESSQCSENQYAIVLSEGNKVGMIHNHSDSDEDSISDDTSDSDLDDVQKSNNKLHTRKLKPNLTRDQIVVAKDLKKNYFVKCKTLPDIPRPSMPQVSGKMTPSKMSQIQEFISSFEYNFLSEFFFDINKRRPFHKIMDTCKEIISDALPIRCVEGTFLAIYMTQNFENIIRYPISFRSCVGDISFKHIVLCIQRGTIFGALGISRKSTLMYKPLKFASMSALIQNFKEAYEQIGHQVLGFTVGIPIPTNPHSKEVIRWEFLQFTMRKHNWDEIGSIVDLYSKEALRISEEVRSTAGLSQKSKRNYYGYLIPKYNKMARTVGDQKRVKENNNPDQKLTDSKRVSK